MSRLKNGVIINPVKLSVIERINAFEKNSNASRPSSKVKISKEKTSKCGDKKPGLGAFDANRGEISSKENIEFRDDNNCSSEKCLALNSPKKRLNSNDISIASDSDSDLDRTRIVEEAARIAEELMNSQLRKINIESDLRTIETRYPTRVNSPRYYTEKKEVMDKANRLLNGNYSLPFLWENRFKWFNCVENVLATCKDDDVVNNQPQYESRNMSNKHPSLSNEEKSHTRTSRNAGPGSDLDLGSVNARGVGVVRSKSRSFQDGSLCVKTTSSAANSLKESSTKAKTNEGGSNTGILANSRRSKTSFPRSNKELISSKGCFNDEEANLSSELNKSEADVKKANSIIKRNQAKSSGDSKKSTVCDSSRSALVRVDSGKKSTGGGLKASYQDEIHCFEDGAGYLTFCVNNNTRGKTHTGSGSSASAVFSATMNASERSEMAKKSSTVAVNEGNGTEMSNSKNKVSTAGGELGHKRECKKLRNAVFDDKGGARRQFSLSHEKSKTKENERERTIANNKAKKPSATDSNGDGARTGSAGKSMLHRKENAKAEGETAHSDFESPSLNYSSNFIRGRMDYFSTDVFV